MAGAGGGSCHSTHADHCPGGIYRQVGQTCARSASLCRRPCGSWRGGRGCCCRGRTHSGTPPPCVCVNACKCARASACFLATNPVLFRLALQVLWVTLSFVRTWHAIGRSYRTPEPAARQRPSIGSGSTSAITSCSGAQAWALWDFQRSSSSCPCAAWDSSVGRPLTTHVAWDS